MNLLSLKIALGLLGTNVIGATIPRDSFPQPAHSFEMTARTPENSMAVVRRHAKSSAANIRSGAIVNPGGTPLGKLYTVKTSISGSDYDMIVALGYATTWVADENWQCYSAYTLEKLPHSDCRFGKTYHQSGDFRAIPNQHLNVTYGDLTFVNGPVGHVHASLEGLQLQPVIGVATNAAWIGYGTYASGVMGLSTNSEPGFYWGPNANVNDGDANAVAYDGFLTTLFKQNPQIPKIISFTFGSDKKAVDTIPDGTLSIGGVPDVPHFGFATTPLVSKSNTYGFSPYGYNINVDKVTINGKVPKGAGVPTTYNLDTYQRPISVPPAVLQAVLDSFPEEKPQFYDFLGGYVVDCNVTRPCVKFDVGGKTFEIPKKDLLNEFVAYDDGSTACILNMASGDDNGGYVLGSVFMDKLVTVIDIGAQQVSLARKK